MLVEPASRDVELIATLSITKLTSRRPVVMSTTLLTTLRVAKAVEVGPNVRNPCTGGDEHLWDLS